MSSNEDAPDPAAPCCLRPTHPVPERPADKGPPLPSCGRAGPGLTVPGAGGAGCRAGSRAAGRKPPVSVGPLQQPPSCGLETASIERDARKGERAARLLPARHFYVTRGSGRATPIGGRGVLGQVGGACGRAARGPCAEPGRWGPLSSGPPVAPERVAGCPFSALFCSEGRGDAEPYRRVGGGGPASGTCQAVSLGGWRQRFGPYFILKIFLVW